MKTAKARCGSDHTFEEGTPVLLKLVICQFALIHSDPFTSNIFLFTRRSKTFDYSKGSDVNKS